MISFLNDFHGFAERYARKLNTLYPTIERNILFLSSEDPKRSANCYDSPIASNPHCKISGAFHIVYNEIVIQSLEITEDELWAMVAHEVGHIIRQDSVVENTLDIEPECDAYATSLGLQFHLATALLKLKDSIPEDHFTKRITVLAEKIVLYRPEWTCGRYNNAKQVAIYYNLITGLSYFFENYSAMVMGAILQAGKNEDINVAAIESSTGISMESLISFFSVLVSNGLLTTSKPNPLEIGNYRRAIQYARQAGVSWVDRSTSEKLPMELSNAELAYSSAVDDGNTICSCLFELTYRCSEMCIHCYNPGATRNKSEVCHRANQKELSLDDYKRIIDDMYENGLVKVCLSGGDPFSKDFAWDLIDYLYKKDIAFDVYTNGQRIVGDVERLADYYPRVVGVSLYSGVPKDHDAITRVPGSWERSMNVIKQLSELAVPMNLKCCVMQPNLHSYYKVADIAKKYGAIPQFEINITESNDGDICAKQLRLTEEQLKVVLRDNNLALYVGKEAPNYGGVKRNMSSCSCGAGGTGFCMAPNGDLRACVAFTQVYGNLNEKTVAEMFAESTALKEWRSAVIADYTECGKHDYCDYCNLCAGINYTEHGDYRKPAETNCYMAQCRCNLAHELMKKDEVMTRDQFIQALHNLEIKEIVLKRLYKTTDK